MAVGCFSFTVSDRFYEYAPTWLSYQLQTWSDLIVTGSFLLRPSVAIATAREAPYYCRSVCTHVVVCVCVCCIYSACVLFLQDKFEAQCWLYDRIMLNHSLYLVVIVRNCLCPSHLLLWVSMFADWRHIQWWLNSCGCSSVDSSTVCIIQPQW